MLLDIRFRPESLIQGVEGSLGIWVVLEAFQVVSVGTPLGLELTSPSKFLTLRLPSDSLRFPATSSKSSSRL